MTRRAWDGTLGGLAPAYDIKSPVLGGGRMLITPVAATPAPAPSNLPISQEDLNAFKGQAKFFGDASSHGHAVPPGTPPVGPGGEGGSGSGAPRFEKHPTYFTAATAAPSTGPAARPSGPSYAPVSRDRRFEAPPGAPQTLEPMKITGQGVVVALTRAPGGIKWLVTGAGSQKGGTVGNVAGIRIEYQGPPGTFPNSVFMRGAPESAPFVATLGMPLRPNNSLDVHRSADGSLFVYDTVRSQWFATDEVVVTLSA